jgi:hypothetical protein
MMNFIRASKCFTPSVLYILGALLCLCFSLGVHIRKSSKAFSENSFSSLHKSEKESTGSPRRGAAESIVAPAQFTIRGATRDKQSPSHPSDLPPAPFTRLLLSSSYSPLNNFADVRSLIFLSPIQDRAPPRFA